MVDVPWSKAPAAGALTGEEIALISQLSASVTITGTTISAQASDNSFNDSANGFVTAGFGVDDYVYAEGFTGNVANNLFSGKITALTAGKMTIGGTDGDVIVDDAAGESVTISKWVSRRKPVADFGGAGGSLVFLGTTNTLSSGSLILSGLSLANYAMLEFCFEELTCATSGFTPRLRISCGAGFLTTNIYDFGSTTIAASTTTAQEGAEDSSSGLLGDVTANFSAVTFVSGHGRIYTPGGSSLNKLVSNTLVNHDGASGVPSVSRGMVRLQENDAIDGILLRAWASSADQNLTGGRLTAWGWLRS